MALLYRTSDEDDKFISDLFRNTWLGYVHVICSYIQSWFTVTWQVTRICLPAMSSYYFRDSLTLMGLIPTARSENPLACVLPFFTAQFTMINFTLLVPNASGNHIIYQIFFLFVHLSSHCLAAALSCEVIGSTCGRSILQSYSNDQNWCAHRWWYIVLFVIQFLWVGILIVIILIITLLLLI